MNALEIVHLDYVIVDTCPENAPDDLQRSCLEHETLEDHVFVSSSDNSVFFSKMRSVQSVTRSILFANGNNNFTIKTLHILISKWG